MISSNHFIWLISSHKSNPISKRGLSYFLFFFSSFNRCFFFLRSSFRLYASFPLLGFVLSMDRILVQGKPNTQKSVTQYHIKISTNGVNYQFIQEGGRPQVRVFVNRCGLVVCFCLEQNLERFSFECRKVIGFALSTRCDWLKRFAPPFHPIRSKTKANCDALACIFPRFASATCNYFEF